MAQKRNAYLDISDEEDLVSDSDHQEEGRASRIRAPSLKKRKLDKDNSDDSQAEHSNHDQEQSEHEEADEPTEDTPAASRQDSGSSKHQLKSAPGLKLSNAHQRKKKKTGVIYLSRIPPFMKPFTLRNLLEPYGTLLRMFLTPESAPTHLNRVRSGGNKKRSFVDGWVEFESKKKAKICAETLNGNIIGGKKGGWYHDDIWNIKYLKGFKWDDLMEQFQDEERIRGGRLRAEIKQENKERRAFMENVERDKIEKTRELKRRKRGDGEASSTGPEREREQRPTQVKVKHRDKQVGIES